jgi:divalent metal cation (Fe/Co/Zn/Cd) transporter
VATVDLTLHAPQRVALARRARLLAWTSLAWLGFEGVATVVAGVLAGSVALIGNGLDSAIEGLASFVVVWRFAASRISSDAAERTAQKIVAVGFFLLAPFVAFEAVRALALEHHAETTRLGMGLSVGTLFICP